MHFCQGWHYMFTEVSFMFSKDDQNCDLLDLGCCLAEKTPYIAHPGLLNKMHIFKVLMMQYL